MHVSWSNSIAPDFSPPCRLRRPNRRRFAICVAVARTFAPTSPDACVDRLRRRDRSRGHGRVHPRDRPGRAPSSGDGRGAREGSAAPSLSRARCVASLLPRSRHDDRHDLRRRTPRHRTLRIATRPRGLPRSSADALRERRLVIAIAREFVGFLWAALREDREPARHAARNSAHVEGANASAAPRAPRIGNKKRSSQIEAGQRRQARKEKRAK
jgi:hypothetical protein